MNLLLISLIALHTWSFVINRTIVQSPNATPTAIDINIVAMKKHSKYLWPLLLLSLSLLLALCTKENDHKQWAATRYKCDVSVKDLLNVYVVSGETRNGAKVWIKYRRQRELKRCWDVTVVDIAILMVMGCIDSIPYIFSLDICCADQNFGCLSLLLKRHSYKHTHTQKKSICLCFSLFSKRISAFFLFVRVFVHGTIQFRCDLNAVDVDVNTHRFQWLIARTPKYAPIS